MIFKEREIGLYKGQAGDGLYRSYGGTSNYGLEFWTEQQALKEYNESKALRSTNLNLPYHIGKEIFLSTERRRPQFNACTHHISRAVNRPYGVWYQRWTSGRAFEPYYRRVFPSISREARIYGRHEIDDGFRARAFWSMRPKFKSEVELLNFIFELKDFRDIVKHLFRPGNTLLKFENAFWGKRRYMRRDSKKFIPDPSLPAAKAHLAYNFAIKPLLRDLAAMQAALLHQVAHAQKAFGDLGEHRQKSHFTEVLFSDVSQITPNPFTSNYYIFSNGYARHITATATMDYRYSYKPRNAALAFMHYWGLTGSAEAFWNMIPFSFVWDYFHTIGNSLKIMRSDPNVDLTVGQYSESTLDIRSYGMHTNLGYKRPVFVVDGKYYSGSRTQPILITGFEETLYTRKLREPYKGPALPKLKLPSSAQGRNLLALARCFV